MADKTHYITFKVKTFTITNPDDTESEAIWYKKTLKKSDCTMRPIDHKYYNSDMFLSMLHKAYKQIIGEYTTWSRLNDLPKGVTVDTSNFLAKVTIQLPETFK